MGSKPDSPETPDYTALQKDQQGYDKAAWEDQLKAGRVTQINPFGSMKWAQDKDGNWTQTEEWSPETMQQILRQQEIGQGQQETYANLSAQSQEQLKTLMDRGAFGGGAPRPDYVAPEWTSGDFQFNEQYMGNKPLPEYNQAAGDQYAKNFTDSLLARVTPEQENQQAAMATKLRLQGLQPGTPAYDRAMKNMLTSHGDVRSQAQLQGMMAGGQEARNVYGTELQGALAAGSEGRADYGLRYDTAADAYKTNLSGNVARSGNARDEYQTRMEGQQQGYDQDLKNYMLPYGTAAAAQDLIRNPSYNTYQVPGFAGYDTAGSYKAADIAGAAQQQYAQQYQQYADAMAARQAKGSSYGAIIGGVAGAFAGNPAAGAAVGSAAGSYFSDENLKTNIAPISDKEAFDHMLEIYPVAFDWKDGGKPDMGLIAQQVAEKFPHLVNEHENGFLMVNYTGFTALLLGAFRHMAKESGHVG